MQSNQDQSNQDQRMSYADFINTFRRNSKKRTDIGSHAPKVKAKASKANKRRRKSAEMSRRRNRRRK